LATRIRLKRMGAKKQPSYRLVVVDQRSPRGGRTIEELGVYDPKHDPPVVQVVQDRALHWLLAGAQPSQTVRSVLARVGVMAALDQARKQRKQAAAQD